MLILVTDCFQLVGCSLKSFSIIFHLFSIIQLKLHDKAFYLYEREACRVNLAKKEQELWKTINKLEIKPSGKYHYDEEYIKINKEVYVRLSLIDAHTRIIINDILITKDQFNKEYIKSFFITSLNGFPLDTIITDGYRSYPQIIDEIGAKHQLCRFHIMENLMKPINKRINILERKIKSHKKKRTSCQNCVLHYTACDDFH